MLELVTPVSDNLTEPVTLEEAARRLGVSVRTVRRRIRSGELAARMDNGHRLVSVPVVPQPASINPGGGATASPPVSDASDSLSPLTSQLQARIAELEADRDRARQDADRWQGQAGHWQAMSQDLSQRLSEVTGTLYRLTEARALAAPVEDTKPASVPWWAFWRR